MGRERRGMSQLWHGLEVKMISPTSSLVQEESIHVYLNSILSYLWYQKYFLS